MKPLELTRGRGEAGGNHSPSHRRRLTAPTLRAAFTRLGYVGHSGCCPCLQPSSCPCLLCPPLSLSGAVPMLASLVVVVRCQCSLWCGPDLGHSVVRRLYLLDQSSIASTCNPTCEQLLAGRVAGCRVVCQLRGVVVVLLLLALSLVSCRSPSHSLCLLSPISVVRRVSRSLLSVIPFPVVRFLSVVVLPSTLLAGAHSSGMGSVLRVHYYSIFRP